MYKKLIKSLLVDFLFLSVLLGISLFLISFYFDSNFLDIGYQDWMVHAFRIKFLANNGPVSWTHTWSNGANIWQSYQFIPHTLTYLLSLVTNSDIPRAMILITISIFVAVRIETYIFLRLLNVKAIPAFIAALMTFTITNLWSGISDFSLQFAYFAFPAILYMWVLYTRGKLQLIFPFIIGLTIYIHPILTFFSGILWVISLFISSKRVFSKKIILEVLLMMIGASLFLYPYFLRDSYKFVNPYFSTKDYLSMVIRNYQYKGLSIVVWIALLISVLRAFMPVAEKNQWIKSLAVFSIISMTLVYLSGIVELPRILSSFQFPRGVAIVGIGICFMFGEILNLLTKKRNLTTYTLLLLLGFYILGDSLWTISVYSPKGVSNIPDPIMEYSLVDKTVLNKRIFTPTLGSTSYYMTNQVKLPYSYLGQFDSNQIPPRLTALTIYASYPNLENSPIASMNRISDYLKTSATQYVLLDEFFPLTKALLDPAYQIGYTPIANITVQNGEYELFEVPWKPINAALIDEDLQGKLQPFPTDIEFAEGNDFIKLDQYIHDFANTIYDKRNVTLPIAYPTQERIDVKIPDERNSNVVYIAESHSNDWVATLNGIPQEIKPAGPNYMAVYLQEDSPGGVLQLKHSWPFAMKYIAIIIILTPIGILLYNLFFNFKFKK